MSLLSILRFILLHPMNQNRPIWTLWRFFSWQTRSRVQQEVLIEWVEGTKLAVSRGMTGATGNIYCGLHEYVDMAFVLHVLRKNDLFIDVGANVGTYTVLASGVCGSRSVSFEPDPNSVSSLRRNLSVNGLSEKVDIVEAVLGDRDDIVFFTTGRDTTNKIMKSSRDDTREVQMTTLDNVLVDQNPRLMKIDVEGYEQQVLEGASKALASPSLVAVIVEGTDKTVANLLGGFGFFPMHYDPQTRTLLRTKTIFSTNNCIYVKQTAQLHELLKNAPKRRVHGIEI